MRISNKEIVSIIHWIDTMLHDYEGEEKPTMVKICKKFSRELHRRGYTTIISEGYLDLKRIGEKND